MVVDKFPFVFEELLVNFPLLLMVVVLDKFVVHTMVVVV